jgi:hypothetical protein
MSLKEQSYNFSQNFAICGYNFFHDIRGRCPFIVLSLKVSLLFILIVLHISEVLFKFVLYNINLSVNQSLASKK